MEEERLRRLREKLGEKKLNGLLVSAFENIRYLSGFVGLSPQERECWLYVTPRNVHLITDSRYAEQARKLSKVFKVHILKPAETFFDLFPRLVRESSDEAPRAYARGTFKCFVEQNPPKHHPPSHEASEGYPHSYTGLRPWPSAKADKKIAFEGRDLKYAEYERLKLGLKGTKLIPTEELAEELRRTKDDGELKRHKKAVEITDRAFDYILGFIRPGQTEKEIALELERFMRQNGSEGIAFDPIVASGAGSAEPHYSGRQRGSRLRNGSEAPYMTSDKKLEKGEILLMDFGAKFGGYCADMTRCVVLGEPTKKQRKVYQTVLEAQEKAAEEIKPGMTGGEADAIARKFITASGFPPYAHSLGHGVGLAIHEAPSLKANGEEVLKEGMVFSIEPGIYLSGWGGVRIEDLVALKKHGVEVLTRSPKQLAHLSF